MYGILFLVLALIFVGVIATRQSIHIGFKTAIILVYIFMLMNYFGVLAFMNYPINSMVAGVPMKGCYLLSDCVIKKTTCSACDCGEPVNKQWSTICMFNVNNISGCKPCPESRIHCYKNTCMFY